MNGNEVITNTTSSGLAYQVHVPDNVNANTPIIFYHHGGGGYPHDYNTLNEYLRTVGSNAIVVEYNHYNRQDTALPMEILADVSNRYNVPMSNFNTAGFSYGLEPSLRSMASVIQQNPNMEPQSIILVDGYWSPNSHVATDSTVLSTLGQNDTLIFAIHAPGITCNDPYYEKWINEYGINMFRLTDNTCYYNHSANGHLGANNNYVWQGLLDFQSGIGRFPSNEAYSAQIFDGSNWVPVNISGKTLDQVYNMVGVDTYGMRISGLASLDNVKVVPLSVSSDSSVLQSNINNVIGKIRTSNFVQNSISFDSGIGGSTTNVPKQIPSVVSSFFSASSKFLETLANDMVSIAQIGDSIEALNNNLALLAGDLNGFGPTEELKPEEAKPEEDESEEAKPEESIPEEVKPEESKPVTTPQYNYTGGNNSSYPTTNNNTQSNPEVVEPEESKPVTTPQYNHTGGNNNSQPTTDNNEVVDSNNNQSVPDNGSNIDNDSSNNVVTINPLDEFPKYEEVYSNENRIVYNFNDKYKIVIHTDGDKIIGIEHYYDFKNQFNADSALDKLMVEYGNNSNLENIVQNDRYVKVIFDENMYNNLTIDDIRKQYSDLKEIVRL